MRRIFCLLLIAAMMCLAGCQTVPEAAVAESEVTAESETAEAATVEAEPQHYASRFTTADRRVSYDIDVALSAPQTALPVFQVTPHSFTAEEAREIATALFGDVEFFEYSDAESGTEACRWEFHPHSYYASVSPWLDGYDELGAAVTLGDTPYAFWAANRVAQDFRLHAVLAYLDIPGSTVSHYSSEEPSEAELADVRAEVERILGALEEIGLGEWVVDSCEIDAVEGRGETADEVLYHIYARACPVYDGVKVTRQKQLRSVRSGDTDASDYYYEQINFDYSDGRLFSFEYQSPLDVVALVDGNAEILTLEQAVDALKREQPSGTDGAADDRAARTEYLVDGVELGLARTRSEVDEKNFMLVPAYTFRASYMVYDADGTAIDDGDCVFVVNAVDGSIINPKLGY